jgi:Magnesium chelatase, subunit ChlI
MLARRLTIIPLPMTLTEALETTRIHSVAGLTGDHTALVTAGRFRAPHHTISDAGLAGGSQLPPARAKCRSRTTGCSSWMHGPSSAAMSWRSCGNRWRRVSHRYNLTGVLDLATLAALAIKDAASRT